MARAWREEGKSMHAEIALLSAFAFGEGRGGGDKTESTLRPTFECGPLALINSHHVHHDDWIHLSTNKN